MSDRFEITTKRKDVDGVGIIDTTIEDKGEQLLTDGFKREVSARVVCDKLNELQELAEQKPLDLHVDFEEWDTLLQCLSDDEAMLIKLKEFRDKETTNMELTFDFKGVYGKNNESIRKQHYKAELASTYEDINTLELRIAATQRRISFLKSMVRMKTELLHLGVRG